MYITCEKYKRILAKSSNQVLFHLWWKKTIIEHPRFLNTLDHVEKIGTGS